MAQIELHIRYFPSQEAMEWSQEFWNNLVYWKAQREMEEQLKKEIIGE